MSVVTSQGISFGGVAGLTKLTVKRTRRSGSAAKLDSSTLALAHGAERTYENGLTDNGPGGGDGIIVTAAVEFLSATKPTVGTTVDFGGVTLKCIDSELTDAVGELKKGTANYTNDFVPAAEE